LTTKVTVVIGPCQHQEQPFFTLVKIPTLIK
jgi:hypothetical protein